MAAVLVDPDMQEMEAVLAQCGVTVAATHTAIIMNEGITSWADFGELEGDIDVTEMAKHLAVHTQGEGHVNLGTIVIKCLQSLVFWVRDHQKHGLAVSAADFTPEVMADAAQMKVV